MIGQELVSGTFPIRYTPFIMMTSGNTILLNINMESGITLGPNFPTSNIGSRFNFYNNQLYVKSASNVYHKVPEIEKGFEQVTPSAPNTPTGKAISFTNPFSSNPMVVATPHTIGPWTAVLGVGVSGVSTTGFMVYVTRTDTTQTGVYWQAMN